MAIVKRGKDSKGLKDKYATYTTPELMRENEFIRRKLEGFQDTAHQYCKKVQKQRKYFTEAALMYSKLRPCEKAGIVDLWTLVGDISPWQEYEKWRLTPRQQWLSQYIMDQDRGITLERRPMCFCFKVIDKRQDWQKDLEMKIFSTYLGKTVYKCKTNNLADVRTSSLFYFLGPYTIRWEDKESIEYTAQEIHDMNYFYIDTNWKIISGPLDFERLDLTNFNQPGKVYFATWPDYDDVWIEGEDHIQTPEHAEWPSDCSRATGYAQNCYLAVQNTPDKFNKVVHVFFNIEDDMVVFDGTSTLFDFKGGAPDMPPEYQYIKGVYNTTKGLAIRVNTQAGLAGPFKYYQTGSMWGIVDDEVEEYGYHYRSPWAGVKKVLRDEDGIWKVTIYGPPKVWIYPSICELYGYTHEFFKDKGIYWLSAVQGSWLIDYIPKAEENILAADFSATGEFLLLLADKTIYYTALFVDDMEYSEGGGTPGVGAIEAITGPIPKWVAESGAPY